MKSFPTEIKLHGLRSDGVTQKNSGFCIDCRDTRAQKWGLEGYTPDLSSLPRFVYGGGYLDMSIDWPFPQVWQTDSGIYIGKRDGIYKVALSAGVWTATKIASCTTNWPWTLANCPLYPVFASGDCFVYYDYDTTQWIAYTGSNTSGSLWNSSWKAPVSVLFHLGQILTVGANVATTSPSDSRVVRWSEIGAFRFLGQTATVERNEAGFLHGGIDDAEILLRALSLGKRVIVYGTFSCFSMRPVESPAPAFAVDSIRNIGIVNPLAVGGTDSKHLLVARDGTIWMVTLDQYSNVQMESVGFSEYFADMQAIVDMSRGIGIVNVVYNHTEEEFYISDGIESFIFNDNGLTRCSKNITSLLNYENAMVTGATQFEYIADTPYAIYSSSGEGTTIQTDILDLGMNAIKTIETIELMGTLPEYGVVEVMIETRVDRSSPFRSTKWVRCNKSGVASPIVAGVELRVNVRSSKADGLALEGLRLWWKLNDKRNIRGNYAATTTT